MPDNTVTVFAYDELTRDTVSRSLCHAGVTEE